RGSNTPDMADKILLFNTRDELTRLRLDRVCYFEADGNYTSVYFSNGVKTTLLTSLVNLENLLANEFASGSGNVFLRIGKRFIVNSAFVFQINVLKQILILTDLTGPTVYRLPVSKEALKNLRSLYMPGKKPISQEDKENQ
ncbi:MAG: LytTR family transcriptional regulator, partial [Muribaculaceae bacterium]|nr:LytTR family transcriptional regulator [Muribaculaceae bacterium]